MKNLILSIFILSSIVSHGQFSFDISEKIDTTQIRCKCPEILGSNFYKFIRSDPKFYIYTNRNIHYAIGNWFTVKDKSANLTIRVDSNAIIQEIIFKTKKKYKLYEECSSTFDLNNNIIAFCNTGYRIAIIRKFKASHRKVIYQMYYIN